MGFIGAAAEAFSSVASEALIPAAAKGAQAVVGAAVEHGGSFSGRAAANKAAEAGTKAVFKTGAKPILEPQVQDALQGAAAPFLRDRISTEHEGTQTYHRERLETLSHFGIGRGITAEHDAARARLPANLAHHIGIRERNGTFGRQAAQGATIHDLQAGALARILRRGQL